MIDRDIISMAGSRTGYSKISHLRQDDDLEEIVAWIPDSTNSLLDLGCGSGSLLLRAAQARPNLKQIAGIDVSQERINEASITVAPTGIPSNFMRADLANAPSLDLRFDIVTMTSVLHWLYPQEGAVFQWISAHLSLGGMLLMTTYRPSPAKYGDSVDGLAREAFRIIGYSDREFDESLSANDIVPLGVRCAPSKDLKAKLQQWFEVKDFRAKEVRVRASSAKEFRDFHVGTYGRYFSRAASAEKENAFFDAIGDIAAARMKSDGYISAMQVHSWQLRLRD